MASQSGSNCGNPFGIHGAANYSAGGVTNFPIPQVPPVNRSLPQYLLGRRASSRRRTGVTPGDETGR